MEDIPLRAPSWWRMEGRWWSLALAFRMGIPGRRKWFWGVNPDSQQWTSEGPPHSFQNGFWKNFQQWKKRLECLDECNGRVKGCEVASKTVFERDSSSGKKTLRGVKGCAIDESAFVRIQKSCLCRREIFEILGMTLPDRKRFLKEIPFQWKHVSADYWTIVGAAGWYIR